MIQALTHYFFPDLKPADLRKFTILGITAFFGIGTYWLLRLLKQAIFFKVAFPASLGWAEQQGALFQPLAKFWSPLVVLAAVLVYSKLIDLVKKHQLFYIICTFYGILFSIIGGIIFVKEWYGVQAIGKTVLATTGWVSYFAVESFGSLVIALFWSFTNSVTDSEAAKQGFPLIVTFAQLGAIGGSALLLFSNSFGAISPFILLASAFIFSIVGMIAYFMKTTPAHELEGNKASHSSEKKKDGFFEGFISGLTLIFTRPYLIGVFVVSTIYEVASQILEYQMQTQASFCPDFASDTSFCWFQGIFGISVNTLSFLIALLGTGYVIKWCGLRISLLVYPFVFALAIGSLLGFFIIGAPTATALLWATFATEMVVKGMSYAFNNPVKEMMYIPTSKDAKFKSKGWIDMFGGRFAKAGGGRINNLFKDNLSDLMLYGTLLSFGLIGIWIVAALYVGKKNQQLVKQGQIVE